MNLELRIKSDSDKVTCNFEWLELMEDTIPYIDNILRNLNNFIINEEDVIKIELAKRVTVESIKHLSKNTNLIQEYDKKTGDDEKDTYWGSKAYDYSISNPDDSSIKINLKVMAVQNNE